MNVALDSGGGVLQGCLFYIFVYLKKTKPKPKPLISAPMIIVFTVKLHV